MKIHSHNLKNNETGFAALVVGIVLLIILSLMSLGFASSMRQEQRSALDNQLTTQAFYAAESGINDAISFLNNNPTAGSKTSCTTATGLWSNLAAADFGYQYSSALYTNSSGTIISYSCLLVNAVSNVIVNGVQPGEYVMVPLTSGVSTIDQIEIQWSNNGAAGSLDTTKCLFNGSIPNLPTNSATDAWSCPASLIEADLVSSNSISSGTISSTADSAQSVFLYPNNQGSTIATVTLNGAPSPQVVSSTCNTSGLCSESITMTPESAYYLRLTPFYGPSTTNFIITAYSSGNVVTTTSAQIEIDATGKATDVLRRIAARYQTGIKEGFTSYAIQSAGPICKQFDIIPNDPPNPKPGPDASQSSGDCKTSGY